MRTEFDLNEFEIDLNEFEIDLNEFEIDLNESEHFLVQLSEPGSDLRSIKVGFKLYKIDLTASIHLSSL